MNKRGRIFNYLIATVIMFGIFVFAGISNVYAAGEHEISLKFYNCYI